VEKTNHRERKCADTINSFHNAGSLSWPFPKLKHKYIFHIKYTEAILSNSTWKLFWFEITKMLTAVLRKKITVIYYNFRHTFVPYNNKLADQSGDDREISFLFQRLSVLIQRFNAILQHDCFVKEEEVRSKEFIPA